MNICITPESAKNFTELFTKQFPYINKNDSAEAVIELMFKAASDALSSFGNDVKVKEVVLQHLGLGVIAAMQYAQKNPKVLATYAYPKKLAEYQDQVLNAVYSNTEDFQKVLTTFSNMVGLGKSIVPYVDNERFNAVSLNLAITTNQEMIWDPQNGYGSNIEDPAKQFEFAAIRTLLNFKPSNISFKVVSFKSISGSSEYIVSKQIQDSDLVLIPVDQKGNLVKFKSDGSISQEGSIPVFTFKTKESDFAYFLKTAVEKELILNPDAVREQVETKYKNQISTYVNLISEQKKLVDKGETVLFKIDYSKSSDGFIEMNRNVITPLTSASNISADNISIKSIGNRYYPVVSIPSTKLGTYALFEKTILDYTDSQFEMIHYLLTAENISVVSENGKSWNASSSKAIRNTLLRQLLEVNTSVNNSMLYLDTENKTIRLWNKVIPLSQLTVNDLKEFVVSRVNDPIIDAETVSRNSNVNILNSFDQVTQNGQWYKDGSLIKEAKLPIRSFNLNSKNKTNLGVQLRSPLGLIKDDSGITIKVSDSTKSLAQHIYESSYVSLVPNGKGELKGAGTYLAFEPSLFKVEKIRFFSGATNNKTVTVSQENIAEEWFKNSPLSKVITLLYSSEHSDKGPSFLASFLNDSITLFKGSDKSLIYHESFHAYFNALLTSQEREEIYNVLKKQSGSFSVVVNGVKKTTKFSEATPLELEEYLAEEFRFYALNGNIKKHNSKVVEFFKMLYDLLKSIFGKATYSELRALNKATTLSNKLFFELYSGNFNTSKFSPSSTAAERFSSLELSTKDTFTLQEISTIKESLSGMLSNIVSRILNAHQTSENRNKALTILDNLSKLNVEDPEYKRLSNELDVLNSFDLPRGFGVLQLQEPQILTAVFETIKDFISSKLEVTESELQTSPENRQLITRKALLEKTLRNFGSISDIAEYKTEETPSTVLSLFLKDNAFFNFNNLTITKALEEGLELNDESLESRDETSDEVFIVGADQYNNNVHELSTIGDQTKILLQSIQKYTNQGKGLPQVNSLGFPSTVTLSYMHHKVLKLLNNSIDALDMCKKLRSAAETDQEFKQLYLLLGDLELNGNSFTQFEHSQWNNFFHTYNMHLTELHSVIANKVNTYVVDEVLSENLEEDEDPVLKSDTIDVSITTGKIGQESQQIISSWKSNFQYLLENSPYSEVDEVGKPYLDIESLIQDFTYPKNKKYRKLSGNGPDYLTSLQGYSSSDYTPLLTEAEYDAFKFLDHLGINIVDDLSLLKGMIYGDPELNISSGTISYFVEHLKNRLNKGVVRKSGSEYSLEKGTYNNRIYDFKELFESYKYEDSLGRIKQSFNQTPLLNNIRDLHYAYSNEAGTFMAYTADGNKQNQMSYSSSLYNTLKVLNTVDSYDTLLTIPGFEHFDLENNPTIAGNSTFKALFNLYEGMPNYGKRNPSVKITAKLISGSKLIETDILPNSKGSSDKGVKSFGSDEITKFISDIALTLDGKQETPRAEAKNTSVSVNLYHYRRSDQSLRTGRELAFKAEEVEQIMQSDYKGTLLSEMFVDYLESELLRITEIKKIISSEEPIVYDAAVLNRGLRFQFFDDILTPEQKIYFENLNVQYSNTLYDLLEESPNQLLALEKQLKSYFVKRAQSLEMHQLNASIPKSLIDRVSFSEEDENASDRLYLTFLLNNTINNLNYSTLFLGDYSNYNVPGEAYHKRIAGFISTGKGFRDDAVWLDYLNKDSYGFSNKETGTVRTYTGYLNTAILAEKKTSSIYLDYYSEYLGIDTKAYSEMDEADGQGWISFDSYRLLSKSSDEWSDDQERIYQLLLSGNELEASLIRTTFPVRKFQYFGPVQGMSENVKLPLTAFHKYSLAPLIPNVITNTPLETLHKTMMKQNLDYVTMQTGSKLGTLTKVVYENGKFEKQPDVFYKSDRTLDEGIEFTKNVIHTKYLKNQLYMAEGYKSKITLPTQLRKVILLGLFDGTIPTDYKGTAEWNSLSESDKQKESKHYNWYVRYNKAISDLTVFNLDSLKSDLGLIQNQKTGLYEGDPQKLISFLKSVLEDKELLPDEIEAIIDPETNSLIPDLSLSLHSATIEKGLITLIDKRLRKLKINGEPLVQVSGAMYESFGVEPVIDKLGKLRYGSNQLKFYHSIDKYGTPTDNVDDAVKTSKMEVMISLQGDYKKLLNLKHTDGFPIKVKVNGKVDFVKSLDRLNEMLQDYSFFKTHESKLTLPGVRIPTQAENSLYHPVVKKFLPEVAGPIIVLPSEIVAQSGSDFDIDKMYAMMKNLGVYNGVVEEIVYKKTDVNISDLKTKLSDYKKDLTILKAKQKTAYTEYNNVLKAQGLLKNESTSLYNMLQELNSFSTTESVTSELIELQKNQILEEMDLLFEDYFGTSDLSKDLRNQFKKFERESLYDEVRSLKTEVAKLSVEIGNIEKEIDQNSVKGLENNLMNLFSERMEFPTFLKSLVTPNTTKDAKEMADFILERRLSKKDSSVYNKRQKENSISSYKEISITEVAMYEYNLFKHQENSVGMDALGIAAVVTTYNALFSTIDGEMQSNEKDFDQSFLTAVTVVKEYLNLSSEDKSKYNLNKLTSASKIIAAYNAKRFLVKSNTQNGVPVFGKTTSADGKLISDLISQLVNGFVDVAADAWVFNIEGNKENTPVLLTMLMAGVSLEDSVYMSTHPLVVKYNRLKKSLNGPFSNLDETKSIIGSNFIRKQAMSLLFNSYGSVWNKHFGISSDQIPNYKTISNLMDPVEDAFSTEELKKLSNSSSTEFTFRDLQLFSHYLEIEDMASEITELTSITKFDTTKISTISAAQQRLDNMEDFSKKTVNQSYFGRKFYDQLVDDTLLGSFNNDYFISGLFDRQFYIRNNKSLLKKAMELKVKDIPKGMDLDLIRTHFKNDFIWFLYQNAVYSSDQTTLVKSNGTLQTYDLIESTDDLAVRVDDEAFKIYYNPKFSTSTEISKSEYSHVRMFFSPNVTQIKNFIAFKLQYEELLEKHIDTPIKELEKEFYLFDKPNEGLSKYGPEAYRRMLLQRAAMYYSKNPNSMFHSDLGIVPMIQQMKAKHLDLQNYALIQDMRWDYDKENQKFNIFLPGLSTDPDLVRLYRENLKELSNHPAPEVQEFFNVDNFTHIALMQTGLNRNVKTDIARIGDPTLLRNVLMESNVAKKISKTLEQADVLLNAFYKDKSASPETKQNTVLLISQFSEMFKSQLKSGKYRLRNKGVNYTVSELDFVTTVSQTDSVFDNKVTIFSTKDKPALDSKYIVTITDLLQAEDLEKYIQELSTLGKSSVFIQDSKLIAPTKNIQRNLDKLLLKYLGIDNYGESPVLIKQSKFSRIEKGITLAPILSSELSDKSRLVYEAMAVKSNKAIGYSTESLNKSFKSSASKIETYLKESEYSKKLNPSSFKESDTVFVFGSSLVENAYLGYTKEQYKAAITKDFQTSILPLLSKAVKAGSTLYVGSGFNGVDAMTREFLNSSDYVLVPVYDSVNKYYEAIPFEKSNADEFLSTDVANNTILNEIVKIISADKTFSNKIKSMSDSELLEKGLSLLSERFVEYMKTTKKVGPTSNVSYRDLIIMELVKSEKNFNLGTGYLNTLFERFFSDYRAKAVKLMTPNQLTYNVNSKQETFDTLDFSESKKESILRNLASRYSTPEKAIAAINKSLKSDFEGTYNRLKNCM